MLTRSSSEATSWIPEIFDPSVRVVWLSPIAGGEGETVGLDGMARTMKDWMQSWEQVTTVAERLIDRFHYLDATPLKSIVERWSSGTRKGG